MLSSVSGDLLEADYHTRSLSLAVSNGADKMESSESVPAGGFASRGHIAFSKLLNKEVGQRDDHGDPWIA